MAFEGAVGPPAPAALSTCPCAAGGAPGDRTSPGRPKGLAASGLLGVGTLGAPSNAAAGKVGRWWASAGQGAPWDRGSSVEPRGAPGSVATPIVAPRSGGEVSRHDEAAVATAIAAAPSQDAGP